MKRSCSRVWINGGVVATVSQVHDSHRAQARPHPGEFGMDRRGFNRRVLLGGAAVATSLSLAPEAVSAPGPVRTAPAGGEVRRMKLDADRLAGGQMGYGLEKGKASVPGPLIELNEGDTLHIEFENTMDVPVSLHVHGLDYEISSDGTKQNKSDVPPGG